MRSRALPRLPGILLRRDKQQRTLDRTETWCAHAKPLGSSRNSKAPPPYSRPLDATNKRPLPDLAKCRKIGFIIPSSNTAVEPIARSIIESYQDKNIICLFTRVKFQSLDTHAAPTPLFSAEMILEAARLLADAECHAVIWSGVSGQWIGGKLEGEQQLTYLRSTLGRPFGTTTVAIEQALGWVGATRISIAVP